MNNTNDSSTDDQLYSYFTFGGGITMLVLSCIGLYGNIMSILIYTRRTMRSSINVLLTGLSIIDLFLLVMCIPVFILPSLFDYFQIQSRTFSLVLILCLYPLTLTAQTCSVWTFVVISAERYFAVCRPFQVQKFLTPRRAKFIQIAVVGIAVLYNSVRFWEYRIKDEIPEDEYDRLYEELLRNDTLYFAVYYTGFYLLTHFLAPFLVIVVLNVCVIATITKAHEERCRLSSHQISQHKTSRMIIVVTITFALCNFLTFVLNIWETIVPELFTESQWRGIAFILLDVSNMCIMINSGVNFIFYLVYCRRYRILFRRYNTYGLLQRRNSQRDIDEDGVSVRSVVEVGRHQRSYSSRASIDTKSSRFTPSRYPVSAVEV